MKEALCIRRCSREEEGGTRHTIGIARGEVNFAIAGKNATGKFIFSGNVPGDVMQHCHVVYGVINTHSVSIVRHEDDPSIIGGNRVVKFLIHAH